MSLRERLSLAIGAVRSCGGCEHSARSKMGRHSGS